MLRRFMEWIASLFIGYYPMYKNEAQERSERAEQVKNKSDAVIAEAIQLRSTVNRYQQADDPLAELVRTLRTNRRGQ